MEFLFKTDYNDDIRFLARTGEKIRVGLVAAFLVAAPLLLGDYYLAELGLLLVYAIAGIGLMTALGQVCLTYGLTREAAGPATVATSLKTIITPAILQGKSLASAAERSW